jgi:hypothetical protein
VAAVAAAAVQTVEGAGGSGAGVTEQGHQILLLTTELQILVAVVVAVRPVVVQPLLAAQAALALSS